jgi:quinol monooxygenase YgiN
MSTLYLVVSLIAKPEQEAPMKQALVALIAPTRAEEGCLQYDLHTDRENPRQFFLYERWSSDALWQAHMDSAHIKSFVEASGAFTETWALHQLDRV